MDGRKRNNQNNDINWDNGIYGTGRIDPPKRRGGLLAMLLILVIFLCGVITVLGILNIRLFQQLNAPEEEEMMISFSDGGPTQPVQVSETQSTSQTQPAADQGQQPRTATLNLQSAPEGIDNIPDGGGMALQDIYEQNLPSVASITASLPNGTSTGTGVVLTSDGFLVTNAHVVEGSQAVTVQLTNDQEYSAQIVGKDDVTDLAVLYIEAQDLTPAQFGDSSTLRVGDTVVAIGDPLGVEFRGTFTNGIISGIDRDVDVGGRTMTLIQTNAALNAGNSGGPLINCYGQVIGINTMKISTFTSTSGVEGIGFAIPSATVKTVVDQIIAQGYVSGRPTLGIVGETLSSFYQHYYRMPAGLYITQVLPESDACIKGIEEGDLLLYVNDNSITSMEDLKSVILNCQVGQTVQAVIYRGGKQYQLELTLTEDRG